MTSRRTLLGGLAALSAAPARAQGGFPLRPLRMVIPYAPGTAPDTMARAFCEAMRAPLGQPVIPDNRPGAAGNIGATVVARSAPDGYTLTWGANAVHSMNEFMFPAMPFDAQRDFEPIALCIVSSMLLAVRGDAEVRTLTDLVALAKRRPGVLNCAVVSATGQVGLEMFRVSAGVDIVPVSYRSSSAAATALLGGEVQVLFDTLTTMAGPAAAGQIRVLAATPDRRIPSMPEVPTFRSLGYDVDIYPWAGIYAPRGLPPDIAQTLNRVVNAAVQSPEVTRIVERVGSQAIGGTPAELAALEQRFRETFGPVIRRLGLTPG